MSDAAGPTFGRQSVRFILTLGHFRTHDVLKLERSNTMMNATYTTCKGVESGQHQPMSLLRLNRYTQLLDIGGYSYSLLINPQLCKWHAPRSHSGLSSFLSVFYSPTGKTMKPRISVLRFHTTATFRNETPNELGYSFFGVRGVTLRRAAHV